MTNSDYKNGVYTSTVQYGGLLSSVTVTLTLTDDIITTVEVTPHATNPTSLDLQQRFAEVVPMMEVGKNIDEVNGDVLLVQVGHQMNSMMSLDK